MRKEPFTRDSEDSLIIVKSYVDTHSLGLALDTGASHTTVDLTQLLMAGYDIRNAIGTSQIETASGYIDSYIFIVEKFTCMGITKYDMEIAAYDFFAYHLLADFEGVWGLDFFGDHKFCIDLKKSLITLE
jgi:hypothetical protein